MSRKRVKEGTVFLIPLREGGGYAIGVMARNERGGIPFGYFFGSRIQSEENVDIDQLKPENAILLTKFGDLGFYEGTWRIIGKIPNWIEHRWALPPLARKDDFDDVAFLSYYSDKMQCIKEISIPVSEVEKYPYDWMPGSGALEIELTKIMRDNS